MSKRSFQRRRFLLYHEFDFNYRQIAEIEHCRPQSIRHSVIRTREKIVEIPCKPITYG
jgi:RNA polymerase sigma-70 factor (ECF subfamily)